VAYEEHILQICEAFAGLQAGRADILRRALVKCQQEKINEIGREFSASATALGRSREEILDVWGLVVGFQGYAFCRAHSTAYGVEAYEAAHLKRYYPAEFLSAVLTNGKGFYNKLVYSIECRRLGIGFLPPDINRSKDHFRPEAGDIRVPLNQIKGLGTRTLDRWVSGKPFASLRDFYLRCQPSADEMAALVRVGAFDVFGQPRTAQFWEFRELAQWPCQSGQGLLLAGSGQPAVPTIPLVGPTRIENLRAEQELLGFTVGGHPLDLYPAVAWNRYRPIGELAGCPGQLVAVAGLIIEERIHRQADGRNMKFISICDYTGILECEMFADAYRRFGLETIRHPVVEITGRVTPFESGRGFTMEVSRVRAPRQN